ncbi:MAG TPA: cytochrome c oxidase subunit 3 [Candidatus Acidoferrum sp.]|jgi:cytochrome c oxidase subunit 3
MASFTPTAPVDDPRIALDDRGIVPPVRGGGDGRSGPGSPDYRTRLRRARLGLLVALTPVLMLFVSFTSAYIVRQGLPTLDPRTNQMIRDWIPIKLPTLLLANTFVLLLSTASMELARGQMKREVALSPDPSLSGGPFNQKKAIPWLALTVFLGICFLTGQWLAWRELASRGFYVATSPSSSFIYLLTGAHAIHLLGGVLALSVAAGATLFRRPAATRSILVDVTAWYWHFMALLWVYILCLLEFGH